MEIVRTVLELRATVSRWRGAGERVALIPTMGALHRGHRALIARAKHDGGRAAVTIFVNPRQFGPAEDFVHYPRDEAGDVAKLEEAGADLLFAPGVDEMYAPDFSTVVSVGGLTDALCGPARPGHFEGVATVVAKLLLQAAPDRAYFGEKDFQQLQVIRRLVRDLDIPVEIRAVPTLREADGLALSSRNALLSPGERRIAPALYATLSAMALMARRSAPDVVWLEEIEIWGREALAAAGFRRIDYLEIRDETNLTRLAHLDRPARVFAAAFLGTTRLIDNVAVLPEQG